MSLKYLHSVLLGVICNGEFPLWKVASIVMIRVTAVDLLASLVLVDTLKGQQFQRILP